LLCFLFFFQAEDGIRDFHVTGVQTCALPISFLASKQRLQNISYFIHSAKLVNLFKPSVFNITAPQINRFDFLRIVSSFENDFLSCWNKNNRSEEHTSELQSRENLVCRLLLE